jgi:hypothetical protein
MNKTIYIRDEDIEVWNRARELSGDKLSPVIVAGLKRFIKEKEAEESEAKGFERIEVFFNDSTNHNIPKRKAFQGRWVFSQKEPFKTTYEDESFIDHHALALTAKGNVAVLTWRGDNASRWGERFYVFPSLEAAAAYEDTNLVARQAIKLIGVPIEELDI